MSLSVSLNYQQITQMLAQDSATIEQLIELLQQEQEQLPKRDHALLSGIVEQKNALLEQLNHNARLRQQQLVQLGLSSNAEGWDLFLQRNTTTLALRADWQALQQRFAECQKLNEVNGKVIARSRQTLDHLLNLIRGKTPAANLYTASGAQTQQSYSHSIAKA